VKEVTYFVIFTHTQRIWWYHAKL